ncbi:hypothetical protein DL765_001225 [Monosporascus sp. GIB2]|nr:hypothetical protein DL765_001225 [Monosporascus sp. GIB2]
MKGQSCRRLASCLINQNRVRYCTISGSGNYLRQHSARLSHILGAPRGRGERRTAPSPPSCRRAAASPALGTRVQPRGKKTRPRMRLEDLPQGLVGSPAPLPGPLPPEPGEGEAEAEAEEQEQEPAYPTVVLQARRNMRKFENCVLLTRVGGFYELYFEHAEEYGPLLNLKVARKKTSAGPVPMAGFPFFQLERFLKILVSDLNCYVAIAEEFPNDPGDKVKSGGLMHDRRVTRIITSGTLIDENFIDPYANNYVMAIHLNLGQAAAAAPDTTDQIPRAPTTPIHTDTPIGLAWLDISTGQFYTQSTTVSSLSSILSRVAPREIVIDEMLESQSDLSLFAVLADDKHLISFAPQGEFLPLSAWTPMLESEIPAERAQTFTRDEVAAGSLLLQYVKNRLLGLSMKLQPPLRHENLSVMAIDKNSMRSLEIKQTIRDGTFKGSLLHAIRRTVTKGGARLLSDWLSAPSTCLETIRARQDLVECFIRREDLREEIVTLLRRCHDSQRLVQKFAFGRGDADDMIALANTIRATQDTVSLLESHSSSADEQKAVPPGDEVSKCFEPLLSRIVLDGPAKLASRIRKSIDEEGLVLQQQNEDDEASQLAALAEDVVAAEGSQEDAAILPKMVAAKRRRPTSMRDYYADDNLAFTMKPGASRGLRELHAELSALLREKETLAETLRERHGAPSLTLKWTPNLGHICHVRGRDARRMTTAAGEKELLGAGGSVVGSSRSTRALHVPEWTHLGQRIHQARFQISAEERRLFQELRAAVVANLVRLRRNAAAVDELDVASSFARLAAERGLVRPRLDNSTAHAVVGARHPTVEPALREQGRTFTKNDCLVGSGSSLSGSTSGSSGSGGGAGRLWLITGPNMAGKSTYLRQNALLTILAQAGSWVPADHASLGIVDAIYSRVGAAADSLHGGQSTFMVEMLETAAILRAATPRSLVVMDEIGRGTTPEDGAAVAFAALHHLVSVNRCRALFATHFHALADWARERGLLASEDGGGGGPVEAYCTDVEEDGAGGFVYVHKLRRGVNRRSHALKVARLAGLPEAAIAVAREVLGEQGSSSEGAGATKRK